MTRFVPILKQYNLPEIEQIIVEYLSEDWKKVYDEVIDQLKDAHTNNSTCWKKKNKVCWDCVLDSQYIREVDDDFIDHYKKYKNIVEVIKNESPQYRAIWFSTDILLKHGGLRKCDWYGNEIGWHFEEMT
jgi:hypothetical protein